MSPFLAFGFSTPLLLWGAALGAIPIVIHLLHRRKHREMPWAAMQFLVAAIRKNTRRVRLEQLLLLLVRVLILVLLAAGLAQPYAESLGKYFQSEAPTHRILVIDATYSMGYRVDDVTRFEQACEIARSIVSSARQGDAFNLLRISGSPPRSIVSQPAFQKQQVLAELAQLQLTDEPGDLLVTLQETLEAVGRAKELSRKEVYFLSDFQSSTWNDSSNAAAGSIRAILKQLAEAAEIQLIDVGQSDAPNLAVEDLVAEDPFVAVGRPVLVQATLRNYAGSAATQSVELAIDGRLAESQRVDLPAGGQARADFQVTLASAGEHAIEVRLPDDALPADNRRWLSLPARSELRILLVNGRQAGRESQNATWYVQRALAPSTGRQRWQGFTNPTVISEGELASSDLSKFDVVVLSNVALFTEREFDILKNFVGSGGGLIVGLGDQVRPENYNQMLYREGDGLLPARLGDRTGNARDPQDAYEFDAGDLSHPILRPFVGNPGTGLESTLTFEYVRVALPADGTARAALKFSNGDPALVTGEFGRGRIVLFTTSLDASWSSWAVQRSFPPVIHESVQYAVAGRWSERQRLVGEPIHRAVTTVAAQVQATVRAPDGREKPMQTVEEQRLTTLVFDGTERRGLYEAVLGPPLSRTELFAVNVNPRESDLTKLDEQQLQTELLPGVDFVYQTEWRDRDLEATLVGVSARGGLTRWLLFAALALLMIEQLMSWRFTAGFSLLGLAVGIVLIRNAWSISPAAGAILLVASLGTAAWLARRAVTTVFPEAR